MIPVALDYQTVENPRTREAQFLRPLMKQRNQEQGVWIFSPEGKALGGFVGFGDMVGRTKKVIEDALTAFGPVRPREASVVETHPYWGKGRMPDGSVCLAEYVRTSDSALRYMNTRSPVISGVTLSEQEFMAFAPREAAAGAKWTLPEDVAKRLSRITSPMCYQHAPQPDWVTGVRIDAEVRTVKDGAAWLAYQGRISSAHHVGSQKVSAQEIKLTGEGVFDLETRRMRSLLLVGSGRLHWPEAPEKLVTFDALVEWGLEAPRSSLSKKG
jgi:hypothetical protein